MCRGACGRLGGLVPETTKTNVDVAATLEELHQITEVAELDTSGRDAGPLGQVHPLGWAALGLIATAIIFHLRDTDWLIGNFSWWHWAGLAAIVAVSLRPGPIKAISRFIDRVTDFFQHGANSFASPRAAFVVLLACAALVLLCIGPLQSFADWIFGVSIEPDGSDFFVESSTSTGWIRTVIATVVVAAAMAGLYRALAGVFGTGDNAQISVRAGALLGVAAFVITLAIVGLASTWSTGITAAFGAAVVIAALAVGPLWIMGYGIFVIIFFYVVTRYTARFIEADIIIGEVNSLGFQMFAALGLLGLGYGVKAGVNPRIDFWWADFSNRRKAWLDFVLHVTLFIPFLWAGLRVLHKYAKTNLGFKTDFSGETDGSWPASWHVWETWIQDADAGNLPVGPIRALIFFGFILFLAQILSETIKAGFVLIRREDLAELKIVDAPARVE